MPSVGVLPALALVAGAACGVLWPAVSPVAASAVLPAALAGWIAWRRGWSAVAAVATATAFFAGSIVLSADARERALQTPLRTLLGQQIGGFALDHPGPAAAHDPILVRALLLEDASVGGDVVTLRADAVAVRLDGPWMPAAGGVVVSVGGRIAPARASAWRAGRLVEAPATFRRPSRYLNDGVPDFERDLALDGTTLFASVKSGLLVDVRSRGSFLQEAAAHVRAHVRRSVDRWVAPHDVTAAGIVTAVLIGDRTGLPDDVRLRLQRAGTYHVIAISGGNIAILAGLTIVVLLVCGIGGRRAALVTLLVLAGYAQVVTAGASVWRATLMAAVYLTARLLDHRSPPWHAMAMAAAVEVSARPLDVRDPGFLLTFGATAALLEGARRAIATTARPAVLRWVIASLTASCAAEVALLPVSAWQFSRVTSAGLVLNLLAVPLMAIVQLGGLVLTSLPNLDLPAAVAGWTAYAAARALVDSARVVEVAPWLAARVPPPPLILVVAYYVGLAAALNTRRLARLAGMILLVGSAAAIVAGAPLVRGVADAERSGVLRMTLFDVGQGEAALLQGPDASAMLVDTGGVPFGGSFDIGGRVLAPALWARGVRTLDALLVTHGDPDHIGGGRAIVDDFAPRRVWEGVPVAGSAPLRDLLHAARSAAANVESRYLGHDFPLGGARVRVLHPPPPDWERQRVRNDDSVVLEVLYGDAALLLTGDIGAEVERAIVPRLTRARLRVLKVAHHGSRTSSSRELLEHWRPQVALISCGRGNSFGHPAPEVLRRLHEVGADIYRTDLHGQITVETDGREVSVRTYVRSDE